MRKIFFVYLLLSIKCLFGQTEPKGVKSPDAANLEKFGKYGVGLSTGTVDVNIPLHQLKNTSVNLSLNFDTSGLKISEPAGIAGVNWTMQQPGIITRTINGFNDEYKSEDNPGFKGYFFFYDALNYPNLETQQGVDSFDNYLNNLNDHPNYVPEDLEPDIFNFTVLGKSGKFFLGNDGVWKVQSDYNFKIIINESDFILPFNYYPTGTSSQHQLTGKVIGKITMIDDEGNYYIFGADNNSIEFSVGGFFNQKMDRINSTAWYLNEMKDRLGNVLFTCSYFRDKPIARFYNNLNNPNKDFLYKFLSGSIISPVYLSSINSKDEEVIFEYGNRNDLSFANEVNLEWKFQKIKTNNDTTGLDPEWTNKLYFLYTNFHQNSPSQLNPTAYNNWAEASKLLGWKKLDKVTVRTNSIINKEINFDYINKPDERLFLTNVRFSNNHYVQENGYDYKIKYNNGTGAEYNFTGSLPNYLWTGKNIFDNYSSLLEGSNDLCYLDCGGVINDELVKKGSLFKIIYPTGGFTYFDFEQNVFSKHLRQDFGSLNIQPSSKRNAGGLRIKKIVNFPDLNSVKRETISYNYFLDDYNSSGILVMDPQFLAPTNDAPWYAAYTSVGSGVKLSYTGPPVLYSKVSEERENDSGLQKIEYFFTNYDTSDYYLDKPWIVKVSGIYGVENFLNKYIDMSFLRGKLIEKKIFDNNNNLLIHNSYEYEGVSNFIGKFTYSFSWAEAFPKALRKIYYGDFQLSKEINREYFNAKEFKTEIIYNRTDYPYKNSDLPIYNGSQRQNFISTLFPDGVTLKTETEYQFGCSSEDCFNEPFALPKKTKTFKNNILLSQDEFTYKTLNEDPKSLVTDEMKNTKNNSVLSSLTRFTKYDSYGNIIEYQKENGIYVSIIMDSKGAKPLVKVENVRYDDLAAFLLDIRKPYISSSDDAISNITNPSNFATQKDIELRGYITNLRNSFNHALITSYTYDSYNRLKTITLPNGFVEFYEYDNLHRLIKVKDDEGNDIKEYKYNYTEINSGNYSYLLEEIANEEYKFTYLRNNCNNNQVGDLYNYTIPSGKYKSLISSNDLYSKVLNDANQHGQNLANLNGSCLDLRSFGLTPLSTIQLDTSSLYLNGNTVSGYIVFKNISINSQTGSYIARVPNDMIPAIDRYYSYHETGNNIDRYWSFTIHNNGYVSVIFNGTPLTSNSVNISSFNYQK